MDMHIKEYKNLDELMANNSLEGEEPVAFVIMNCIRAAAASEDLYKNGLKSKELFLRIYKWKNPRFIGKAETKPQRILTAFNSLKGITGYSDQEEINRLRVLLTPKVKGVGIPVASAVLTILDADHYGVIDVNVWRLLYKYRSVTVNPNGAAFDENQWLTYLKVIRHLADAKKVSVRTVERTLFEYSKVERKLNEYRFV